MIPIAERFWGKVAKSRSCWLWNGALNMKENGYGVLGRGGRGNGYVLAHRLSFEIHNGVIPDGMLIDHICRVRRCVNPKHLRVVTPRVNAIENNDSVSAVNASKTQCFRGHLFTPENTILTQSKGRRTCRVCYNAWRRKSYAKRNIK